MGIAPLVQAAYRSPPTAIRYARHSLRPYDYENTSFTLLKNDFLGVDSWGRG